MLPIIATTSIPSICMGVCSILGIGVLYETRKQYKKWSVYSRKKRVILFTKYPIPGVTKTRLIPTLGEVGSARIQQVMTDRMLDVLNDFQSVHPDVCLEIKYFGGSKNDIKTWLDRKPTGLIWSEQNGNNLGEKMANAFKSAFKQGAEHVVIIGADIPGINCHILKEAFDKLENETIKDKVVLGPSFDGGYYLIGIGQHNQSTLDAIMRNIVWSTKTVLAQQKKRAKQAGLSVVMLSKVLQDIDTANDLPVLEEEANITVTQILTPKLSVIIPTLNEVDNIDNTITTAIQHCTWPEYTELIVCDGGSQDGTVEKVEEIIKNNSKYSIKIVQCPRGRGKQQSVGVEESTGDILLFLHADILLPDNYFETILITLGTPGISGGAFRFDLDQLHSESCPKFFRMKLELLKWGVRTRGDWNGKEFLLFPEY
uniref:Uncharacterized protein LOC100374595 n=1 Tax=Saccoglossus kowalevskii TaxID=10224 RepID=A0ABM0MU26_SACKO|nr:PREDICTED: uncharacterized protein LOC100374595 [Saccoglossus kowalevskii]